MLSSAIGNFDIISVDNASHRRDALFSRRWDDLNLGGVLLSLAATTVPPNRLNDRIGSFRGILYLPPVRWW